MSVEKERVWVWGVGWLGMFDLTRDFEQGVKSEEDDSEDEAQVEGSRKRRRIRHGKENPSGAGGVIPEETLSTGISRKVRKLVTQEDEEKIKEDGDIDLLSAFSEEEGANGEVKESPNHWHTFKYRPILGMVVVGEGEEDGAGPEVAVVERPIWEASLPPRFYGEQEWRDKNFVE